jgi:membrane-bound lytic murein transglycosylase D
MTQEIRPAEPTAQPAPLRPQVSPVVAAAEPVESPPPAMPSAEFIADREIWLRLREGFRLRPGSHPRIDREIRRLQRSPSAFQGLMERSRPYLHYILDAVEQAGLPTELALLPAVESGFRVHVYSPDGAAGLWQIMPATGGMLGLKRDWWFDGRRTVRASTTAAIAYLQKLETRFSGNWEYALAAYNAGARTVGRAIQRAKRRGEATDFWSLDLPGETDRYVPRLFALTAIIAEPEKYGMVLPEIVDRPFFVAVDTGGQIDLTIAAQLADIPVEQLLQLNAGHKRWASRPGEPHELLVPVGKAEGFQAALAQLSADERLRWQRHTVVRGDSLNRIARQYEVSVAAIRHTNHLKDSRIRAGKVLLIPLSETVGFANTASNPLARQRLRYLVRKGDSLYTIARRFQVSIADLKRWNRLGRYIYPGERLTLFIEPDA